MSCKRLCDVYEDDSLGPNQKRMRRLPSFATVIRQAMFANSLKNLSVVVEPLLRKVVMEEMERFMAQRAFYLERSSQPNIQAMDEPSSLQLIFQEPLSIPIFTGTKVEDINGRPLQVTLVDTRNGQKSPVSFSFPLKLEVVALDGEFPLDGENWSSLDFQKSIVKERAGRRPLIIGEVQMTLRDACSCSIGELIFTDNSSWIRSRRFRIGLRVVPGSYEGPRIKEAITEAFVVKDHRGEFYRKHYPPSLDDEVWRLERIGKDGIFHSRLRAEGINTVQDFLKMSSVDPQNLRRILGVGMSDRMWEGTLSHAKTCLLGQKVYLYQGSQCVLFLNPICKVVGIMIQNVLLSPEQLTSVQRAFVQQMVKEAYDNWDKIDEMDQVCEENASESLQNAYMTQGTVPQTSWYNGFQENEWLPFNNEGFAGTGAAQDDLPATFHDVQGLLD
ncbi:hypothetical protein HPP92_000220 [Vanilla planifolia]|uniref:Protein SAR DEFICIENT 1 n=1 Tax=Vanilla planifolia TaxID=51239 RepID=A0A835SA98_VANPL|nr:hypothetical protein HPP92_000220 [Vanilla planifolia]